MATHPQDFDSDQGEDFDSAHAVFAALRGQCPVAEAAYERLITLPLFHGMVEQDVDDVVTALQKVSAVWG